jgi:hypothetical protein
VEPTNREQRRHPEKLEQLEQPGHPDPKQDPQAELAAPEREQEDQSVRAKSTGHKKKTADKWNQ